MTGNREKKTNSLITLTSVTKHSWQISFKYILIDNLFVMQCCVFKNKPFPCSKKSHFQNEAKCETFVVKMSFICIIIKNHFHINSFALSLALKVRFFGTRKWPIRESLTFRYTSCWLSHMSRNYKKIYFTTKQQWQISHFTPISKQREKSRKNSKFLLVKS